MVVPLIGSISTVWRLSDQCSMNDTDPQPRIDKHAFYADRTRKPILLSVLPESISAELRERPQWVCWRLKWVVDKKGKGKWDKPPVNPRIGRNASSTDPMTWATFNEAMAYYKSGGADGIGFMLSEEFAHASTEQSGKAIQLLNGCYFQEPQVLFSSFSDEPAHFLQIIAHINI